MEVIIEDNGTGLRVTPEEAMDPFYTTKKGKKTGLGLALFQAAAERAGGRLVIGKSPLGGVAVKALMQLSHVDRSPLGDLAATLSSIVCTNPGIELWCRLVADKQECMVRVTDVAKEFPVEERCGLAVARRLSEKIKQGLTVIGVTE
jgi:signal transduction histidine kinase